MSASPLQGESAAEVELLRRQLARERRARLTAEQVGERATAELYDTVQRLERAQDELQRHAEDQLLLSQLARELRRDLHTEGILRRAVTSVGAASEADRCLIRLVEGRTIGPVVEQWSRPGIAPVDPAVPLPLALQDLCLRAADERQSLQIDDIGGDPRLSAEESSKMIGDFDTHAYLGTPLWVGDQLMGWLVVHACSGPRSWTARQLAITDGVANDLATALMQGQAFQKQAEAVGHLEQVSRVKTELVSTVSHELRTPLTSITGYLELLQEEDLGSLSTSQRHILDVISRNTGRLLSLIEDLLSLSRLDSGAAAETLERVNLQQVLSEAGRAMRPTAAGRNIGFAVSADGQVPAVLGNAQQLEQVLLNLLSNAIKFTADGGRVTAHATATPAVVSLTVTDTGHGIAPEDLPHVFDRFYRSNDATERAIQGTGLGLTVVKAMVEAHRGTVTIDSTLGLGTTVTVTLPRAAAGHRQDPRQPQPAPAPEECNEESNEECNTA